MKHFGSQHNRRNKMTKNKNKIKRKMRINKNSFELSILQRFFGSWIGVNP